MLSKEIINKLEKIGFIWDVVEHRWNEGYNETLKYREEHGEANCGATYVTEEGHKLGMWQSTQRRNYKNGSMSKERIEKLEKIGFIFKFQMNRNDKGQFYR